MCLIGINVPLGFKGSLQHLIDVGCLRWFVVRGLGVRFIAGFGWS
jgi:hypothetical protein